jgi:hypothetical protein
LFCSGATISWDYFSAIYREHCRQSNANNNEQHQTKEEVKTTPLKQSKLTENELRKKLEPIYQLVEDADLLKWQVKNVPSFFVFVLFSCFLRFVVL